MKKMFTLIELLVIFLFLFMCHSIFAGVAGEIVWQLGKPDGLSAEFAVRYFPWEYGSAPHIPKHPLMNTATHTFNYDIAENTTIPAPALVQGLASERYRTWMEEEELVSGLELTWQESEAGNRKFALSIVDWRNNRLGESRNSGQTNQIRFQGIDLLLPDGGKRTFHLPIGQGEKEKSLTFSAIFPVAVGSNTMTIRIKSMTVHYRFNFDCLTLTTTDEPADATPILESSFPADGAIYHPGEEAVLAYKAFNLPAGQGDVAYTIKDAFGKEVTNGTLALREAKGQIRVPTSTKGWFEVSSRLGDSIDVNTYVTIEPVTAEYIDSSRFGCHAIGTDGYRDKFLPNALADTMRKAFLAGAKWGRLWIKWSLREPEQGQYNWDTLDARLALADKYKIRAMCTVTSTPKWASSSDDTRLGTVGARRYEDYPPKDGAYFADFMTALVSRYQGRIRYYELGNEPGYQSAYWLSGSAPDFGQFLKAGYTGAKKADPNSLIVSGAPLNSATSFFEEAVKSTGGKCYFDVMSMHYLGNHVCGGDVLRQWITVLEKMGAGNMPLINSEEMNWRGDPRNLQTPAKLIQTHVREAALGIDKTFAFDFFRNGSLFGVSAFDYSGAPLPRYAAYRTMTHRLEYATFVADLSSANVEAYLFDRQGVPVIVCWTDNPKDIPLQLGVPEVSVINIMDVSTPQKTNAGILLLPASSVPVFIEGGNVDMLQAYAAWLDVVSGSLLCKPGASIDRVLNLTTLPGHADAKLNLPTGWHGALANGRMSINIPADAHEGIYDVTVATAIAGYDIVMPMTIEVSVGGLGANLIRNGDFSQGSADWYFPPEKAKWQLAIGAGTAGGNAAQLIGTAFFGTQTKIKVRPGEKYLLMAVAKGCGFFGCVYSLFDEKGNKVFPKKQGINCLNGKLADTWKTFSEVITIHEPTATLMTFGVLANHRDTGGNTTLFDTFAIVRLTDMFTPSKALFQGCCSWTSAEPTVAEWAELPAMTIAGEEQVTKQGAKTTWTGDDDLSASCRLAIDNKFLYLNFHVKDSTGCFRPVASNPRDGWAYDSIQFAFDPGNEGKDQTQILIGLDADGKPYAFKHNNFWTPEIPWDITRYGFMTTVDIVAEAFSGGMNYRVKIPLNELYPLSAASKEFGFCWLANDNDGDGRKYAEWSGGIGKTRNSSLFGFIRVTGR
jgi:hypothetical protein